MISMKERKMKIYQKIQNNRPYHYSPNYFIIHQPQSLVETKCVISLKKEKKTKKKIPTYIK